jgi:hypothetical protein
LIRSAKTLQNKNEALLAAATDIFGLYRPWGQVKDGLSDARIREFHRLVASLWPVGTDQRQILPPLDSSLRFCTLAKTNLR